MQLDEQTKQNNEYIRKLIVNNFSLSEKSEQKFLEYLYNPWIRKVPEYDFLFSQPDLRCRYPLSPEFLEELDTQWKDIQETFQKLLQKHWYAIFRFC